MSQTLINGTAYTIDHGNTLVNSTQYTIDHGNTLVNGTQYKIEFAAGPSFNWVGWDNADWQDINNLCYCKQQGYIDAWPDDVVVGATKSVTLTSALAGTTTHNVTLIGRDQDGDGTLTFQTTNCLANGVQFNTSSSNAQWVGSNIRSQCTSYYNKLPNKDYIKTVSKGTCPDSVSRKNGTATYNNETVFILSATEVGYTGSKNGSSLSIDNSTTSNSECTAGYNEAYSYYSDDASRIKNAGDTGSATSWWLRSRYYQDSYFDCAVASSGVDTGNYPDAALRIAPAFVIGNPDTQTVE